MKPLKRRFESLARTIEIHGVTLLPWCYRAHASIALENHAACKKNGHSVPTSRFVPHIEHVALCAAEMLQSILKKKT